MRIVAGRFRGKQLSSPEGLDIRPTSDRVRESIFNILASRLGPAFDSVRVLDLFAGTGALGLEALSRGASFTAFVDSGVEARGLIRHHVESFGLGGETKLLKRDATALGPIEKFKPFDLVFIDPPYSKGLGERALVEARDGGWLAPDATIVLEEARNAGPKLPDGFTANDRRDYGETSVHIWQYEAADKPG
jgi:16S rRNA (guanine966-N2)-methyltransferase